MSKISARRARQAILVNDGLNLDPDQDLERINLFDEEGNHIAFVGGVSVPPGGDAGQVLGKVSSADYDFAWIDAVASDGGGPGGGDGYILYAYTLDGNGDHVSGTITATPKNLNGFPFGIEIFDSPTQPRTFRQDGAGVFAFWIRVDIGGDLDLFFYPPDDQIGNFDGYAFLYDAVALKNDPVNTNSLAEGDDEAGKRQPRIQQNVGPGDYLIVYTGYDDSEFGRTRVYIGPNQTAVLANNISTDPPAEQPPTPVLVGGNHADDTDLDISTTTSDGSTREWQFVTFEKDCEITGLAFYCVTSAGVTAFEIYEYGTNNTMQTGLVTPVADQWVRGNFPVPFKVQSDRLYQVVSYYYPNLFAFPEGVPREASGAIRKIGRLLGQYGQAVWNPPLSHLPFRLYGNEVEVDYLARGPWSVGQSYDPLDEVTDGGRYWAALVPVSPGGTSPSNETDPTSVAFPGDASLFSGLGGVGNALPLNEFSPDTKRGSREVLGADGSTVACFYFDVLTAGTVVVADTYRPNEYLSVFNEDGSMRYPSPYSQFGYSQSNQSMSLTPGRYFVTDFDNQNANGGGLRFVVECFNGATIAPTRNWQQIRTDTDPDPVITLLGGDHAADAAGAIPINDLDVASPVQYLELNAAKTITKIGIHCSRTQAGVHFSIQDRYSLSVLGRTLDVDAVAGEWIEVDMVEPLDVLPGFYNINGNYPGVTYVDTKDVSGIVADVDQYGSGPYIPFRLYGH